MFSYQNSSPLTPSSASSGLVHYAYTCIPELFVPAQALCSTYATQLRPISYIDIHHEERSLPLLSSCMALSMSDHEPKTRLDCLPNLLVYFSDPKT